jgi:hypothetical protein
MEVHFVSGGNQYISGENHQLVEETSISGENHQLVEKPRIFGENHQLVEKPRISHNILCI